MNGMNKFKVILKVFNKLNVNYPSDKVVSTLNKLQLNIRDFMKILEDQFGSDLNLFFVKYLRDLNEQNSDGVFVDASKYFEPGSFITYKVDPNKAEFGRWAYSNEKVLIVPVEISSSWIVTPWGEGTYKEILDGDEDLGSMAMLDDFMEQLKSLIETDLTRKMGVEVSVDLK
jgi:hypothetical protein